MKLWKKITIGIMITALLVPAFSHIGSVFNKHDNVTYADAIADSSGIYKDITATGALGTSTNPFVVLEVVPNYKQAQFGYLVGGQEPIDLEALRTDGSTSIDYKNEAVNYLSAWLDTRNTDLKFTDFRSAFAFEDWTNYQNRYHVEVAGTPDQYSEYRLTEYGGTGYKLKVTERFLETEVSEVFVFDSLYESRRQAAIDKVNAHKRDPKEDGSYNAEDILSAIYYADGAPVAYAALDDIYVYAYYIRTDGLGGEYTYDVTTGTFKLAGTGGFTNVVIAEYDDGTKDTKRVPAGEYIKLSSSVDSTYTYIDEAGLEWQVAGGTHYYDAIWHIRHVDRDADGHEIPDTVAYAELANPCYDFIKDYIITGQNGNKYVKINHNAGVHTNVAQKPLVRDYLYTIEIVDDGTGEYELVYKNYAESSAIAANAEEKEKYKGGQLSYAEADYPGDSFKPTVIPNNYSATTLYNIYDWEFVSKDIFKKYSLGLIYKDNIYGNGEEATYYEFKGWYYESECVNPFNATAGIKGNTTLYAKWIEHYTDASREGNYYVQLSANCEDAENTFDYSFKITDLSAGSKIVAPKGNPTRAGYKFTGWYLDEACTQYVNFPYTISQPVTTLYAGWTPASGSFTIGFSANVPAGETVNGMTSAKIVVMNNNRTAENATALSLFRNEEGNYQAPTRYGYVFGGWYWDSSCTREFDFDAPIPGSFAGSEITLYAKWFATDSIPHYSVSFNSNEPADAAGTAEGTRTALYVEYGKDAVSAGYSNETYVQTLDNNLEAKLANYQVKVVTVTPEDLKKSGNQKLLDRANLIVFSSPLMSGEYAAVDTNTKLVDYFNTYRNQELFPDVNDRVYASGASSFTDAGNDIDFSTALKVLDRLSGRLNNTCPVIFDYNIFTAVTSGTAANTGYTPKFSNNANMTGMTAAETKGYSNNLYKLYLMCRQMNPITCYNAYINDDSPITEYSIDKTTGNFIYKSGGTTTTVSNWNYCTLMPWNAISRDSWNQYKSSGLTTGFDLVGVNYKVELDSSYITNGYSAIDNRLAVFNDKNKVSLAYGYANPNAFPQILTPEIGEFLGVDDDARVFSMADGIYYMLTDTSVSENFDKDLRILELEPAGQYTAEGIAASFQSESYWFWLIARYVPNYSGSTSVTRKSTSEFIGDISNISADYDILYVGGNDTGIVTSYMPAAPKYKRFAKETNLTIADRANNNNPVAQSVKNFRYVYEPAIVSKKVSFSGNSADKVGAHRVLNRIYARNQNSSISVELSGGRPTRNVEGDMVFTVTEVRSGEYYFLTQNNKVRYFNEISAVYTNGDGTKTTFTFTDGDLYFKEESGGAIYFLTTEEYQAWVWDGPLWGHYEPKTREVTKRGNIYIRDYYVKVETTRYSDWISTSTLLPAGTKFQLRYDTDLKVGEDGTYVYAHTGKVQSANGNASESTSDSSGYILSGGNYSVDKIATSGNDITSVKYEALLDFVEAGYPVIIGNELLSGGQISTSKVDTASYMYQFLEYVTTNEACRDLVFFEESEDTTNDDKFLVALKNKNFRIEFMQYDHGGNPSDAVPVEYHDRTLDAWKDLTDAQVYVNGADVNNKELEYVFTLTGTDTGYHTLKLYIDTNADGKFNPDTEVLDSIDICEVRYNASADEYVKTANARANRLVNGKIYKASLYAGEYIGAIPWKLEVVSNDNANIVDDVTGMCAIKAKDSEKANAYVLQIIPRDAESNVYLPNNYEVKLAEETNGGANLVKIYGFYGQHTSGEKLNVANKFYKNSRNLDDFNVEFFRLRVDQLEAMVKERKDKLDNDPTFNPSDTYWFRNVVGTEWGDYYVEEDITVTNINSIPEAIRNAGNYTSNTVTRQALSRADIPAGATNIDDSGKSSERVTYRKSDVYSRDEWGNLTIPKVEITDHGWDWGREYWKYKSGYYSYTITEYTYRDRVRHNGEHEIVFDDIGLGDGVLKCRNAAGEECEINMMVIGFEDCFSDFASNADGTAAAEVVQQFITQGKATLFTHDTTSYHNKPGAGWGVNINAYFRSILKLDRYNVMTVPEGKLGGDVYTANDYPYATGGDMILSNMATTTSNHKTVALKQGFTNLAATSTVGGNTTTKATKSNDGQIVSYPYEIPEELDIATTHAQYWQIDFEGDDIVVWYSLANGSEVKDCYKTKNDVRNNYYIYSAGNITYSGVGHSGNITDDESKLFINTMVAAYKAITTAAEPTILNTDKSTNSEDKEYLYINYDESVDPGLSEPISAYDIISEAVWTDLNGNGILDDGEQATWNVMLSDDTVVAKKAYNYYKRVFFTVNSYSIVLNKELTVLLHPVDTATGAVYREYPMNLQVYEYDPEAGVISGRALSRTTEWNTINKRSNGTIPIYTFQDGARNTVTANVSGFEVHSGGYYYVDIPLNDEYYADLFTNGRYDSSNITLVKAQDGAAYGDTVKPANYDKFGLTSGPTLEVQLEILMRYGEELDLTKPESGTVNIVFSRRGLFELD